jgi:hypothetical protein
MYPELLLGKLEDVQQLPRQAGQDLLSEEEGASSRKFAESKTAC